jgi:hypothetical protein
LILNSLVAEKSRLVIANEVKQSRFCSINRLKIARVAYAFRDDKGNDFFSGVRIFPSRV